MGETPTMTTDKYELGDEVTYYFIADVKRTGPVNGEALYDRDGRLTSVPVWDDETSNTIYVGASNIVSHKPKSDAS